MEAFQEQDMKFGVSPATRPIDACAPGTETVWNVRLGLFTGADSTFPSICSGHSRTIETFNPTNFLISMDRGTLGEAESPKPQKTLKKRDESET